MGTWKGYRITSEKAGVFPERFIEWKQTTIQPEQVAELSAYENSANDLIRKTAKNKRFKITMKTVDGLTDKDLKEINDWIDANITNEQQQNLTIIAWNDRKSCYMKYPCYVPNVSYTEKVHTAAGIKYTPITITFISTTKGTEVDP